MDIEADIDRAVRTALEYARASDAAFSRGEMLAGWKFYRWRCLAMTYADELMRARDAVAA